MIFFVAHAFYRISLLHLGGDNYGGDAGHKKWGEGL